jgi:two-component SAPR family response regulator
LALGLAVPQAKRIQLSSALAARLCQLLPDLKVIFMSGYLDHIEQNHKLIDDSLVLEKPFTRELLLRKVNEALRSSSLFHLKR